MKLTIQKEVFSSTILQQTFVVEFAVHNQVGFHYYIERCPFVGCTEVEAAILYSLLRTLFPILECLAAIPN